MAGTISNALTRKTAKAAFWQAHEARPDVTGPITHRTSSDSDQENYPWLASAPSMREMGGSGVGGRLKKRLPAIDYTITNAMYESTVEIGYKLRRLGQLGQIASTVGELGAKARDFPNTLVTSLLTGGATNTCYDGTAFFGGSHVDPGAEYATAQDNDLAYTVASTTVLTDLEAAAIIRQATDAFWSFKDAFGDPVVPSKDEKFLVMVASGYRSIFRRVLTADLLTGGVGNDVKDTFELQVNPWLTAVASAPHVYVFRQNGAHKPFVLQEVDPVELTDDAGGDDDFNTKAISFGAFWFGNVGYGDWRYATRTVLST